MPELPDIEVYIEALDRRVTGEVLQRVRLGSPFLLRSVDPPLKAFEALAVRKLSRLGKRIVSFRRRALSGVASDDRREAALAAGRCAAGAQAGARVVRFR